jgi:hypothetical protein
VHCRYGGTELALPLLPGAQLSRDEIRANGWDVRRTAQPPLDVIRLELDPNGG